MTVQEAVDMLNEAVTLSPRLWSLFDVQVPCDPIVGHVSSIELMDTGLKHLAFANTLGMINGVINDPNDRVCIILENSGGRTSRKFAIYNKRTHNGPGGIDVLIHKFPEQESGS